MMKKLLILFVFCFTLVGCSSNNLLEEQQKVYNGFKESLTNNGELISKEIPFQYGIEIEQVNGKYIYKVKIDDPLVVMTSIQMLVLNPNDLTNDYVSSTKGIFDEQVYNMVPNQQNIESGYVNEIILEGVSDEPSFKLYTMVVFKDRNQLTQKQIFFSFNIVDGENVKGSINE